MNKKINKALVQKLAYEERWLTLSNFLTCMRIILAPCFCGALYYKAWVLSFIIFLCAAGTDLLDGFLARLFNDHTHLGKLLDPLADKLFLISSLGSLAFFDSPFFKIPVWFFVFIVMREIILVSGGYAIMTVTGNSDSIRPSIWGKLTTFSLVTYIIWVFLAQILNSDSTILNSFLLAIISFLSFFSLVHYVTVVYWEVKSIKN